MCCFIGNDLITRFTVDGHCDLITHRARRQENRSFLPEQFGNFLAQSIDTGVEPLLLIANLGFRHGLAHSHWRLRLCVAV